MRIAFNIDLRIKRSIGFIMSRFDHKKRAWLQALFKYIGILNPI